MILWAIVSHLVGIYLFTRGFLLTRLSLPNISLPTDDSIQPTHKRAIIVVVDALRFDFISPHPPAPPSPHFHNVLTLPRDLSATRPRHSFIFNAYADPPTTTLQRIKAITAGSLPTFIDIGNSFSPSQAAEDSLLNQLKLHNKNVAFMGDDTWLSVFPNTFPKNLSFPFDSFNVEDLHTVDNGIVSHFFPLLSRSPLPFDVLIAHFLGVDHVGHRLGPDHPAMRAKLLEINSFLKRTIDMLPPDTLLVVLGDHGMDPSGDHGGDGIFETSSALWIYSKQFPLFNSTRQIPSQLLQYQTFPGSRVKSRFIQQIDLVPSLALLLGLPIPYNNLGTVIPELFWLDKHGKQLEHALSQNAQQIMNFLRTYRDSPLGSELDEFWDALSSSYAYATDPALNQEEKLIALQSFTRSALKACRSMWAQFNSTLMSFGLLILFACLLASYSLYTNYPRQHERDQWLASIYKRSGLYTLLGTILGLFAHSLSITTVSLPHFLIFSSSLSSSLSILFLSPFPWPSTLRTPSFQSLLPTLLPLIHASSFVSNSFTFWEDRTLPFLLITSLIPYLILALYPSTPHKIGSRMLYNLLVLSVCTRLISTSTVCREEQQPYCVVTFFASRSVPEPPRTVLYLILPIALILPSVMRRYSVAKRFVRHRHDWLVGFFFGWVLRPSLVGGTLFWIVEWVDSAGVLDVAADWTKMLRRTRTGIAWVSVVWIVFAGGICWWFCPITEDEKKNDDEAEEEKERYFGTRCLILWSICLGIIWTCTQLTGQAILALSTVGFLSFLELVDCTRTLQEAKEEENERRSPQSECKDRPDMMTMMTTTSTTPLVLLALLTFYGTGHQSSLSSIQWKAGFVLTENVQLSSKSSSFLWSWMEALSLPLSGLTIVLNSIGAVGLLGGFGSVLLGCCATGPVGRSVSGSNTKPTSSSSSSSSLLSPAQRTLLTTLSSQTYFLLVLLGSSLAAAVLRRHLMVWKVFAPRFMLAVLDLVIVDLFSGLGYVLSLRGK